MGLLQIDFGTCVWQFNWAEHYEDGEAQGDTALLTLVSNASSMSAVSSATSSKALTITAAKTTASQV